MTGFQGSCSIKTRLLWIVVQCFLLQTTSAFAAPPLTIDDAEPVAFPESELDVGTTYEKNSDNKHFDFPIALTQGVLETLQVNVGLGGQTDEQLEEGSSNTESGLQDLTAGAKWKVLDQSDYLPALALVPTVKFPTADKDNGLGSGKTDYDFTITATRSITDISNFHFNAGYSWIGGSPPEDASDLVHFGAAAEYQLTESVQLVAEVFSQKEIENGNSLATQFNAGLRWEAVKDLFFWAAAGGKVYGDLPNFTTTAGLTWYFCFSKTSA